MATGNDAAYIELRAASNVTEHIDYHSMGASIMYMMHTCMANIANVKPHKFNAMQTTHKFNETQMFNIRFAKAVARILMTGFDGAHSKLMRLKDELGRSLAPVLRPIETRMRDVYLHRLKMRRTRATKRTVRAPTSRQRTPRALINWHTPSNRA